MLTFEKEWNERNKLYAEGRKFHAEGNFMFFSAVVSKFGNVEIKREGSAFKHWNI